MLDSRIVLSDPAKSGAKVDDRGGSNKIWIKSKWQPGPGSLGSGGAPNTFDGAARADGVRIGQAQGVMPVGVGANGDGGGGPAATRMPQDDASYSGPVQVGGGFKAERAAPQDAGTQPSWHDQYPDNNLAPQQFGDSELPFEDALAACGPTAAIAFLRANGRNMTLHEAVKMAQGIGAWDQGGMHGPDSEVQLLQRMGVAAKIGDADPQTIAREVQNGNPVIVSSAGQFHYLVISGYDPSSGAFYVGNTGTIWKDPAQNHAWQTWDQIISGPHGHGGTAIYMDNPQSPTPSVAADPSVYGSNVPAGGAPAPGNNADRPNQIPGMWSPTTENLDRAIQPMWGGQGSAPPPEPGTGISGSGLPPNGPPPEKAAAPGNQPQRTVRQSGNYQPASGNPDAMAPGQYQAPWGASFTDADMGKAFKWYAAQFGGEIPDPNALKQSFLNDWTQHPDYMRNALGMAQAGEVDSILGGQMQQNVQQQPVPAQRTRPTPVGSRASDPNDQRSWVPGVTDQPGWQPGQLKPPTWNPGTGSGGDVPMQSTLGQGPDPTVSMLRDQTHTPQWGATWQPPGGDPNQHESISGKTF